jgi:ADP-heptose:LPS heptosyltransferase
MEIESLESIVVFRALRGLGDLLLLVPALRALRAAAPRAHVAWIGLPGRRWFAERFPRYIDEFIEFPGFPGIPERAPSVFALPQFFAEMHARQFDLALQMQGSGVRTNPFVVMLGARRTAGFYLPNQYCPDPDLFWPYPAHLHQIDRHLRLMECLGVPAQGQDLEFPLSDADVAEFQALDAARALEPGGYVCIHPGANEPRRCWQPAYFAQVADRLAAGGLRIVLTGVQSEAAVSRAVAASMKAPVLDLTGRTGLGALGLLLAGARLVLSNDTGVSHLAVALGAPSVVVFVASDPDRWAPLDRALHRSIGRPTLAIACQHCRDVLEHRCLREGCGFLGPELGDQTPVAATPAMVWAEAESLLDETSALVSHLSLPAISTDTSRGA